MDVAIESSWKKLLESEFSKPYFETLVDFVKSEYQKYPGAIFPPGKEIFRALDTCPINDVKIVILGQDPYHGPRQANGMCFSVNEGIPHPPSLINIFKELEQDLGHPYPVSGDLAPWAEQGVLLLNATLTVRQGQANSHQGKGWQKFTDATIKALSEHREGVIFMLWGGFAKKKASLIDHSKHHVLTSGHPSPLSANKGYWFGNKHFSQANSILESKGLKPVDWALK